MINSAIVKLSKLTVACPIYRGIPGRLPNEFLKRNEYGVRGGIEPAFMSTTTDRKVAMDYAAGSKAGIVFCIQQGMVDRGADISWLSQYPHEQEILFAPLTGLEVQGTSVERSVVVVDLSVSINLTALTIEQVGGATSASSDDALHALMHNGLTPPFLWCLISARCSANARSCCRTCCPGCKPSSARTSSARASKHPKT